MIKYRNELGYFLEKKRFTTAAEIGVQRGLFSKEILSKWPSGHLTLIDAWEYISDNTYDDIANVSNDQHLNNMKIAEENVLPFFGRYKIIKGYSNKIYSIFPDKYFDLVYLDANHKYEYVYEDILLWINKVKLGGYLCGHDYVDGNLNEGNFGVKSAVLDFFKRNPDFITDEPWPSWFMQI